MSRPSAVEEEIRAALHAGAKALEGQANAAEHRANLAEARASAMEARALGAERSLQEQGAERSKVEIALSRANLELGQLATRSSAQRGVEPAHSNKEKAPALTGGGGSSNHQQDGTPPRESDLEESQRESRELRLSLKEANAEVKAYTNRVKALELKLSGTLKDVHESQVQEKSKVSEIQQSASFWKARCDSAFEEKNSLKKQSAEAMVEKDKAYEAHKEALTRMEALTRDLAKRDAENGALQEQLATAAEGALRHEEGLRSLAAAHLEEAEDAQEREEALAGARASAEERHEEAVMKLRKEHRDAFRSLESEYSRVEREAASLREEIVGVRRESNVALSTISESSRELARELGNELEAKSERIKHVEAALGESRVELEAAAASRTADAARISCLEGVVSCREEELSRGEEELRLANIEIRNLGEAAIEAADLAREMEKDLTELRSSHIDAEACREGRIEEAEAKVAAAEAKSRAAGVKLDVAQGRVADLGDRVDQLGYAEALLQELQASLSGYEKAASMGVETIQEVSPGREGGREGGRAGGGEHNTREIDRD